MRIIKKSRTTGFLAATLMMLVMILAGTQVYAANNDDALTFDKDVLGQNANDDGAQILYYGQNSDGTANSWTVIGYDGKGHEMLAKKGVITLLRKDPSETSSFTVSGNNEYSTSSLRKTLESWLHRGAAPKLSGKEQNLIISRTLEGGSANFVWWPSSPDYDPDKIKGEKVENAFLWPLSYAEAEKLAESIRTTGYDWWLRSPGDDDTNAAEVEGNGTVLPASDYTLSSPLGARPACYLDPGAIVFIAAAQGGKNCGATGPGSLHRVGANCNDEWSVTIHDKYREDFTASLKTRTATGEEIEYSNAHYGDNEFISAIIVNKTGEIKYYGRLAELKGAGDATGTVSINVDKRYNVGDTLYVFNEQMNGDKKTDYVGNLIEIPIKEDLTNAPVVLSSNAFTYKAKVQKPSIKKIKGLTLALNTDYTAKWSNASSKNAGTYTVTITGTGSYMGTTKATYQIKKAANTMTVKPKTATVKYAAVQKKSVTLKAANAITVKNPKGKVTYKKTSGNPGIKVASGGKITVRKGLKKGTYKVKVKVKAAGNANYKPSAEKTVTCKIRVK